MYHLNFFLKGKTMNGKGENFRQGGGCIGGVVEERWRSFTT